MRFVCDSCRAQYMISDDKVGSRGVKVRCKKCGYVILVRRAESISAPPDARSDPPAGNATLAPPAQDQGQAEATGASSTSGAPGILEGVADDEIGAVFDQALSPGNGALGAAGEVGSPPGPQVEQLAGGAGLLDSAQLSRPSFDSAALIDATTESVGAAQDWFVAIDEKQLGPLPLDKVRELWNRGELGPDSLCWRAGLSDWLALSEVPELASLLAPKPLKPVIVAPAPLAPHTASSAGPVESAFSAGLTPRAIAVDAGAVAAAPSSVDEPGSWKPSAASALASLMKEEIQVLAKPTPRGVAVPPNADAASGADLNDVPAPLLNGHEGASPSLRQRRENGVAAAGMAPLAASDPYSAYRAPTGGRARRGWIISLSIVGGVSLLALAVVTTMLVLRSGSSEPAASRPMPREPPRPQEAAPSPSERERTAPPAPNPPATPSAKTAGAPEPVPAAQTEAGAAALKTEPIGTSRSERGTRREHSRFSRRTTEEITVPKKVERTEVASVPAPAHNSSEDDFDRVFGGAEKRKSAIPKPEPRKPSSVYVPPAPGSSEVPDSLGTADIMRVVVDNKPAIKQCVDEQRKRDASLSGKIVMSWTILASGRTTSISCASDEFKSSYMAQCLAGLIKSWQFPRHKVQGEAINFPFTF